MKNHYHITVRCSSSELEQLAKLTKSKATSIDLSRNAFSQTDRMLTKYHRSLGELKRKAIADIQYIKSLGFDVVRLKIEEVVSGFTEQDVGEYKYLDELKLMPGEEKFTLMYSSLYKVDELRFIPS